MNKPINDKTFMTKLKMGEPLSKEPKPHSFTVLKHYLEHLKNLRPSEFAEKITPVVSYSQFTYDYISLDVTMSNDEKSLFVLKTNFLLSKYDLVTGFFLDHMILPTVSEWRNEQVLQELNTGIGNENSE